MGSGFIWGALLGAAGMWLVSQPSGTTVGFNLQATPGGTLLPNGYYPNQVGPQTFQQPVPSYMPPSGPNPYGFVY